MCKEKVFNFKGEASLAELGIFSGLLPRGAKAAIPCPCPARSVEPGRPVQGASLGSPVSSGLGSSGSPKSKGGMQILRPEISCDFAAEVCKKKWSVECVHPHMLPEGRPG